MSATVERWGAAGGARRLRWVLALAAGAYLITVFVPNGWDKFDAAGFWSSPFERWGYPIWLRIVVGVLETAGGLALVVPGSPGSGGTGDGLGHAGGSGS